jgi:hypothetical protein
MSMEMGMDMSAHGEHAGHHAPSAEHHALWEKRLLQPAVQLPGPAHTADITLFDRCAPRLSGTAHTPGPCATTDLPRRPRSGASGIRLSTFTTSSLADLQALL